MKTTGVNMGWQPLLQVAHIQHDLSAVGSAAGAPTHCCRRRQSL